jgi:hypothetical protein
MSQPANWYPDPMGRFDLRYWDGTAWTEHVSSNGVQSTNPLAPAPPAAAAIQPTSGGSHTAEPAERRGFLSGVREARREKVAARDEFERLAMSAAQGAADAIATLPAALVQAQSLFSVPKLEAKKLDAMRAAVRSVIGDDVISDEEEDHLVRLGDILGISLQDLHTRDAQLFEEFVIAGINDGRVPALDSPPMVLKPGEVAHGSFGVALMKEVAVRQFRAGTQSVSIPLGGGVRYRVGGIRGRSVVVGTEMVTQDTGVLVVTSARSVFMGQAKTLEFRHDKLVGLEQYTDGLRMSVTNRQAASLFKFGPGSSPSIAAAMISRVAGA